MQPGVVHLIQLAAPLEAAAGLVHHHGRIPGSGDEHRKALDRPAVQAFERIAQALPMQGETLL
jgi:hypothetical protein